MMLKAYEDYKYLRRLINKHENWRGSKTLNLIPSENIMSPEAREVLSTDLVHRYTSKDRFYSGTIYIDEIEDFGISLAQRMFKARYANLRPISGHISNLLFLLAHLKPGDTYMCIRPEDGGYPGLSKLAKVLGFKVDYLPFNRGEMNIIIDKSIEKILEIKPKAIILGASLILKPHPVEEISKVAEEIGAIVGYDGSHVLGLIAGGEFQDPLREGAVALYGSTHKSFFGPQGGILLSNTDGHEYDKVTDHVTVDNAHWNRIAALTIALIEMDVHGRRYARQVIKNSQRLARALAEYGLPVVGDPPYTYSHQILLDYGGYKSGCKIASLLEKANIIVDCGVRLGTCEVTRRGMREEEMDKIAEFIARVVIDGEKPEKIRKEVIAFRKEFDEIEYRIL